MASAGPVPDRAASVPRMLLDRVAATPDSEAFRYPDLATDAEWRSLTWRQTADRVEAIAAGLISLGVAPEERVGIASNTRIEWILADFGILTAGAATTTVYPSTQPDDVGYILGDSGTVALFAEDADQLAKVRSQSAKLPDLHTVVLLSGDAPAVDDEAKRPEVITLAELERRGAERLAAEPTVVTDRVDAITPDSLATIIYTSGTTGRPKGVRLVHDCWTYEGAAVDALGLVGPDDLQYLWLPLSHAFGKVLLAAQLGAGFATAVDGRLDKIVDNLAVVRPTFMAGAPRIFEKVRARVQATVAEGSGIKRGIAGWAFRVGGRTAAARQAGRAPSPVLAAQHAVAHRLVFSTLHARFGGRLRFFVSGSAALSREVAEWFAAAGVVVLEGYGLTEGSAGNALCTPTRNRPGSVGPGLPGTEIRIAEDGEVLVKSPAVMRGYHNLPEQTAEVLTDDGWLRTGDIGELDDDGLLRITDRKKDLIKTSGGKYVAPQPIEVAFKALCPLASQVIVHGDGRNYCTALVTLDPDELTAWADGHGLSGTDHATLSKRDDIRAEVGDAVTRLNARLNRWETIKDFRILDRDLTVEEGELTPSMKVRRRVVEKRFTPLLDEMYPTGGRA